MVIIPMAMYLNAAEICIHVPFNPSLPPSSFLPSFPCLQMDSSTLELNYYMDSTKKEKRGSINLSKFVGLCPNAKVGSKDHGFALETEDRKYILRAPDAVTKNVWIAKICELCGQG